MRPLSDPTPEGEEGQGLSIVDMDFVLVAQPDGSLVNIDDYRLPCGHTENEHKEAWRDKADAVLALIADALPVLMSGTPDTPEFLARAEALDLDERAVLAQTVFDLNAGHDHGWRPLVSVLVESGWISAATVFAAMVDSTQSDRQGQRFMEGVLRGMRPAEVLAMVRAGCGGAEMRGMDADAVRAIRTPWHDNR